MNLTKYRDNLIHVVNPFSRLFARLGVTPNQITFISLVFGFGCAALYAIGQPYFAAVALLLSALFDFMDGGVARINNTKSNFGAAIDWIADKYVDGVALIGIAVGGLADPRLACIAVFGSMMNTFIKPVVYAEIGYENKDNGKIKDPLEGIGCFGRPETIIMLLFFSWLGLTGVNLNIFGLNNVGIGVAIIAVMTNLSALQRIYYLYRLRKKL